MNNSKNSMVIQNRSLKMHILTKKYKINNKNKKRNKKWNQYQRGAKKTRKCHRSMKQYKKI